MRRASAVLSALALVLVTGCSEDPAKDKPKAVVGDAVEPEPVPANEKAGTPRAPASKVYTLTDYTSIGFEGSKVTGPHVGGFGTFEGTVTVPGGVAEEARIEVVIDLTSLYSDDASLTRVLKSADFFDVEEFPYATFRSTAIRAADSGYRITGNLDLHGVKKSIIFPAEISLVDGELTAEAEFTIDRQDFGLRYKGAFQGIADNMIRDEVLILLDVEAKSQ